MRLTKKQLNKLHSTNKLQKQIATNLIQISKQIEQNPNDLSSVNNLFDDAYYYLNRHNETDFTTMDNDTALLNNNIALGIDLVDTLENDLGTLDNLGLDSDSPVTDDVLDKVGDIGKETIATRERKLDFVENSVIYKYMNWYYTDNNDKIHYLDAKHAVNAIKDMAKSVCVFDLPKSIHNN